MPGFLEELDLVTGSEFAGRMVGLRKYLKYTFVRLQEQDKVIMDNKHSPPKWALFNSGLVDPYNKPIFIHLKRDQGKAAIKHTSAERVLGRVTFVPRGRYDYFSVRLKGSNTPVRK